jgi:RNA12 protein
LIHELSQRVANRSCAEAVQEIIEQSASEILKMYLLDVDVATRNWTPQQAWLLIKQLAKDEMLRYNEILLSNVYKDGGERTLQALEQAELISISSSNGRPHAIKPGKPVYLAAFKYLTEDDVLRSRLDLAILTQLIGIENKNVDKFESELRLLADLPGQPKQLLPRINWLLNKSQASHAKVEKYEAEGATLKKLLTEQY